MAQVIVVGAGPTGSAAAAVLAQAGCDVLLLDRESFPRDKVCGDVVQYRAIKMLYELGYQGKLNTGDFYAVNEYRFETPNQTVLQASLSGTPESTTYVVRRIVFDHLIYQLAIDAGAQFKQFNVLEPIVEDGIVKGVIGRDPHSKQVAEHRAPLVIVADGATSTIGRQLVTNKIPDLHKGIAIRGYVKTRTALQHTAEVRFAKSLIPGYGWIFPVSDRVANIGVGMRLDIYRQRGFKLHDMLLQFMNEPDVCDLIIKDSIEQVESWQLILGSRQHERVFNGALLAGG